MENENWNNCQKATFLIEKRKLTRISLREILFLYYHLYQCKLCTLFKKQSHLIDHAFLQIFSEGIPTLDEKSKNEIQAKIDSKLDNN